MHSLLVKKVLWPLHERLKGKATLAQLAAIERTQWFDPGRLEAFRFSRLWEHLAFAYAHVPYYRRLLDEHELPPHHVQSFDDFRRIPPLTRESLRAHFADLQTAPRRGRAIPMSTGGSTGSPVTVMVDVERAEMTDAARLRAHRWFGLEPGAREVVVWGSPIELGRQDRIRALRDWLLNSRLLSAFDLGEASLRRYADVIARYRPEKMYGYASALHLLAASVRATGGRPPAGLRAVFTTAEPLFEFERQAIATVFEAPVAVEYGARDAGLIAHECPRGGLHIAAEGIHVEILDANADGVGEIVVTNFCSFALPIIRYRIGDIGRLDRSPCPCGRTLPRLGSVDGRRTDFLVTPRGRVLHALSVIYVLRETAGISQFRVLQDAVDHVVVQAVPQGTTRPDTGAVRRRLRHLLGEEVSVDVDVVATLPPAASGKRRYVISTVAPGYLRDLIPALEA